MFLLRKFRAFFYRSSLSFSALSRRKKLQKTFLLRFKQSFTQPSKQTFRQKLEGVVPWIKNHPKISIALGLGIAFFIFLIIILRDIPSPTKLKDLQAYAVSTKIFDKNGELLYEIYNEENRTPVKISDLPAYVYQSSIAIEDKGFYSHFGFDFFGMVRAVKNIVFSQQLQGGSTITQQLVKTALLTRERTVTRKIKEAVLTIAVEIMYSKNDILEMYLNHIPYG
ncbi:MAG: biosynthetic peptidoglycan transglycosylase, partial [Patescibacteria group bacterium]